MFAKLYDKTRSSRSISGIEYFPTLSRSTDTGKSSFCIINYGNEEGFLILGLKPGLNSVYAVSDHGSLHLSDTIRNKGLSIFLNQGLLSIHESIEPIGPPVGPIDTISEKPITDELIIISTPLLSGFLGSFHQFQPYNKYCLTEEGEQALVGCIPLSIGAIMGYFQYPSSYKGYSFDWNEMINNQYHDSWAHLFKEIGNLENCNSEYGTSGTSTYMYTGAARRSFINFGYKNVNSGWFDYTSANGSLKAKIPVYIEGYDYSEEGGHGWVLDGAFKRDIYSMPEIIGDDPILQSSSYYYHCVWGWNGSSNGYYLMHDDIIGDKTDGISYSCPYTFKDLYICWGMTKGS